MIILLAILWAFCGILAYRELRRDFRQCFGKWTIYDRKMGLFLSIFGPLSLAAAIISSFLQRNDNEASW